MKYQIIPSIIAKNQKELDERINKISKYFKTIQLDIMDGKFVKNKSLMFNFKIPKNKKYEAHLMIENSVNWIKKYGNKVNKVIIHIESKNVDKAIKLLKKKNIGIAFNPATPVKKAEKYIPQIDHFTVLSVNPGRYGAKFIPHTLNKLKEIRKLKPKADIEVDGGLGDKHIKKAKKAGANLFISGSYLQNSKDIKKSLKKLKSLI